MHELPGNPGFITPKESTHTPPPSFSHKPPQPPHYAPSQPTGPEPPTTPFTDETTAAATPAVATTTPPPTMPADRRQEVFRVAGELFRQSPDWVMFFREILGVDGIVRKMFPEPDDLAVFEKTAEYEEILHMLGRLRERTAAQVDENEPTRVITVRLPKSLHESLKAEAHDRRTSMNKLCISKLLQVLGEELAKE